MKTIPVRDAYTAFQKKKAVLIDVRTPSEFQEVHAQGAINIPLDKLDMVYEDLQSTKKPLLVICRSGSRSQMACQKLSTIAHAHSIEGGTLAWMQNNFPVFRGAALWSLERQVRFTAGLLITLATIAAYFFSLWWLALSLVVGLGLVFAAATNTCVMGLFLAKLPWNTKGFSLEKIKKQLA